MITTEHNNDFLARKLLIHQGGLWHQVNKRKRRAFSSLVLNIRKKNILYFVTLFIKQQIWTDFYNEIKQKEKEKSINIPCLDTPRWLNGWIMLRWLFLKSVPARSTPLQNLKEKRTTSNHSVRTWREQRLRSRSFT